MTSRRCQGYPSNVAEFKQRFPNHERNTVHSIPRSIAGASGSRWTAAHLESCRVILSQPQQANEHLEILPYLASSRLHIDRCPVILQSLTFVSAKTLRESTSAELRRMGGHYGAFYSRLAEAVRSLGRSRSSFGCCYRETSGVQLDSPRARQRERLRNREGGIVGLEL